MKGLVDDNSRLWVTYTEIEDDNEFPLVFVKSNDPILLKNNKFTAQAKNYSYDNRGFRDNTITGNDKSGVIKGTLFEKSSSTIMYDLKLNTSSFKEHTLNVINNKTITGLLYVTNGTSATEATIAFNTKGDFTGKDNKGCTISGKFTPAASERYYKSTITFSLINFNASGETLTGVSILDDDNINNLLLRATNDSGRGMYFGS